MSRCSAVCASTDTRRVLHGGPRLGRIRSSGTHTHRLHRGKVSVAPAAFGPLGSWRFVPPTCSSWWRLSSRWSAASTRNLYHSHCDSVHRQPQPSSTQLDRLEHDVVYRAQACANSWHGQFRPAVASYLISWFQLCTQVMRHPSGPPGH